MSQIQTLNDAELDVVAAGNAVVATSAAIVSAVDPTGATATVAVTSTPGGVSSATVTADAAPTTVVIRMTFAQTVPAA